MYQRTATIERGESPGLISGILATDGEASDGHILNIRGGELSEGSPLLLNHQAQSERGALGTWTGFHPDKNSLRGEAQIHLGGKGENLEWRQDIASQVDAGVIRAFSIRWDPIGEPTARVDLPKTHAAYVDSGAKGARRYGLYFEKWRMMEGSVVTLGADPAALIGRMMDTTGDLRSFWRDQVNVSLCPEGRELVGIEVGDEVFHVARVAYDAMLETANERLQLALDVLGRSDQEPCPVCIARAVSEPAKVEAALAPTEEADAEGKAEAAEVPTEDAEESEARFATREDVLEAFRVADRESREQWQARIDDARCRLLGRVTK